MSLINEALKKAQRQRSLDAAPLSSAPSGVAAAAVTTHVRAASHKRSHAALWFALGLVAMGAGTAVLIMRYGFDEKEQPKPVALVPAAPTSTSAAVSPPAPSIALPALPAPASQNETSATVSLPPIAAPTPAPAIAKSAAPSSPVAPPAPTASAAATSPSVPAPALPAAATPAAEPVAVAPVTPVAALAAAPTAAEREAKVYSFLNTIRLTGVRGVDREARVLMNEKVWRLNDVVSPELGLRLSAVRPNLLVFTDSQGRTYEKPY